MYKNGMIATIYWEYQKKRRKNQLDCLHSGII